MKLARVVRLQMRALLCVVCAGLPTAVLPAEVARTVKKEKVTVAYTASVNVSSATGVLVGMWLGPQTGFVDPALLKVGVPASREDSALCFTAITRDGQYSARGPIEVGPGAQGHVAFTLLNKKDHSEQLRRYRADDFAALARLSPSCTVKASADYLPLVTDSTSANLVVAVNSGHSVSVQATLKADGGGGLTGTCNAGLAGRSTGFDAMCRFDPPAADQRIKWKLAITRVPRSGPRRVDEYDILLPR